MRSIPLFLLAIQSLATGTGAAKVKGSGALTVRSLSDDSVSTVSENVNEQAIEWYSGDDARLREFSFGASAYPLRKSPSKASEYSGNRYVFSAGTVTCNQYDQGKPFARASHSCRLLSSLLISSYS